MVYDVCKLNCIPFMIRKNLIYWTVVIGCGASEKSLFHLLVQARIQEAAQSSISLALLFYGKSVWPVRRHAVVYVFT